MTLMASIKQNKLNIIKGKVMSEFKKKFGRRLQELRKKKGINQEYLAEMIDISPRNLSKIETGLTFPASDNLEKIINVLGCKAKELFDFDHQQDNDNLAEDICTKLKTVNRHDLQNLYRIIEIFTTN